MSDPAYPEEIAAYPEIEQRAIKVPPHSNQAEQSVIGGLMLDNASWDKVADLVVESDFYRKEHRLIFNAIAAQAEDSQPFDVVTLAEHLERKESLEDGGGLPYLVRLAEETPSAANIKSYAGIVREYSVMRQLISVGTDITDSAFHPQGRKAEELLDVAERKVFEIAEQTSKGKGGFTPIRSLLTQAVDRIETLFQQDEPITGIST
ncbi:MAG: DnaB-like helicase N-terminal domain-containing protein, partial [Candidatus Thiodiazotropha sp. 6PLUC10]